MRFAKRREHTPRPNVKTDGLIIFQASTQNWRERVKALKAAQEGEAPKAENPLLKPERS